MFTSSWLEQQNARTFPSELRLRTGWLMSSAYKRGWFLDWPTNNQIAVKFPLETFQASAMSCSRNMCLSGRESLQKANWQNFNSIESIESLETSNCWETNVYCTPSAVEAKLELQISPLDTLCPTRRSALLEAPIWSRLNFAKTAWDSSGKQFTANGSALRTIAKSATKSELHSLKKRKF